MCKVGFIVMKIASESSKPSCMQAAAVASALSAAESYPTSEIRGGGLECQTVTVQEQPRGATPRPRSGMAAGRSHPASEARGSSQEEQPHA